MFRTLKKYTDGISPEDDYSSHIRKLTRHAENYFFEEDYRLHTLALDHIFYQSREIANHITRIENLEGMIPICAWCKRIRDENKNWVSVESYISKHAASEFTHGICPDCADKF